jgi:ketosteroid isomerase-like protein
MEKGLTVLLILVIQFVAGQTDQNRILARETDKERAVRDQVKHLNGQEVDALLNNDLKTLNRLWSDDFVVTNPLNKFVSKQEVIGLIESNVLAFTSYERHVEYVRIYGDSAVVAGTETVVWAGKMPSTGQTSHLRFTAVWMKRDARWQEVARHANIVDQQ